VYAYLAVAILSAALAGAGTWRIQEWRHDAEKAEALQEAVRMNAKRDSLSYATADKAAKAEARVRTVTRVQVQEVTKYVSVNDCPMSPSFRVYHDAAAAGEVPDASRIVDAAAVSAPTLAATIAWNYGTCLEDAARLTGLQEWVSEQLKAAPK
jgi:hypothetical protein